MIDKKMSFQLFKLICGVAAFFDFENTFKSHNQISKKFTSSGKSYKFHYLRNHLTVSLKTFHRALKLYDKKRIVMSCNEIEYFNFVIIKRLNSKIDKNESVNSLFDFYFSRKSL